ncbi:BnaC05g26560D [Brassica napus]|uniref:BnaC05g26560D protein n=1 Tax=Brassica napus TaxID=3708 RepID=A0A078F2W5_BRANA|nr:BnaC05g26560D [Brassica napus]
MFGFLNCRFLLPILCEVFDAKIKRNSGIVPMSRQVDASGLENQHGELPENELFPSFKTLKSSQTSKRGLGCFR